VAKTDMEKPDDDASEFENVPSSLDEPSHLEMITLYKESADSVRFAKHLQWWTLGSTLLVNGGLLGIAKLVAADQSYVNVLIAVVILLTISVIFTLVVYQFWQHTELLKMEEITRHMSGLFKRVRRLKSTREANTHRYLLMLFMILTVVLGAVVTYFGMEQMLSSRYY
jgi:Na+/melibiose symporter-like transporter